MLILAFVTLNYFCRGWSFHLGRHAPSENIFILCVHVLVCSVSSRAGGVYDIVGGTGVLGIPLSEGNVCCVCAYPSSPLLIE